MPRTPPTTPPPALNFTTPEPWTVKLQTITPMFGGGAEPRVVDALNPVRAASVRGHLRFWWRATAGAKYENAEDLYKAESEIWGNTEQHGKVRLEVMKQQATPRKLLSGLQLPRETAYTTFPFRRQQDGTPEAHGLEEVSFELMLDCPSSLRPQVEVAFHAWVMFGGVGARTRRGCGSLAFASDHSPKLQPPVKSPALLTTLPAKAFVGQKRNDALSAWAEAVKVYHDFRQGDGIARTSSRGRPPLNGKKAPPGRSFWPEPDSLRRVTGKHANGHEPKHPEHDGYPRADLGLPIVFHFKDGKTGDPEDLTLQGAGDGQERFASPVITKAFWYEGKFVPLLMILDSPHIWEAAGGVTLVTTKGRRTITNRIPEEKLRLVQPREPQNDLPIREALRTFVKSRNFSEVSL